MVYSIIEAPSNLGLRPTGVEDAPEALLRLGLRDKIRAEHAGVVEPGPYDGERDAATRMLNPHGIVDYTVHLADTVTKVLDNGRFPVVLGGDCSVLLGSLLATRRRGRYGLLFLDGHADFYQPEANVNGEAASSELAFATGRGPPQLTRFEGLHPLVLDEDVVVLGHRDAEEAATYGSQPLPPTIMSFDLRRLREVGAGRGVRECVDHLCKRESRGFWIHLDVDVLDDSIMPAVDYRMPGGLRWDELETVLEHVLRSGRATGIEVAIFNPRLDEDGTIARALVDFLCRVLSRR